MIGAIARIDRFMAAHPWDHNRHYHLWLLRQMPARCARALDVGCGTGDLARAMAARADHVEAVDIDQESVRKAGSATPEGSAISFRVSSLLDVKGEFDVITAVAVLHHLDLGPALQHLRGALAPGGRLLVVGCYREATWPDFAVSAVAVPANIALGAVRNPGSTPRPVPSMSAPTRPPAMTLGDIGSIVGSELPGARLRRALFWRYLLRWDAPR